MSVVSRWERVCTSLSGLVDRRERASEETLADFVLRLAKSCRTRARVKDFSYHELIDDCRKYKNFHMKEEERFAFTVGSILGAANLYDAICMERENENYEKRRMLETSKQYEVLELICNQPGLSQKQLCEKMPGHTTPSAMSHLMEKLEGRNYISPVRAGQCKLYYATEVGEDLVAGMERAASDQAGQEQMAMQEKNQRFVSSANQIVDNVQSGDRFKKWSHERTAINNEYSNTEMDRRLQGWSKTWTVGNVTVKE